MSATNVQFSVALHLMTGLAFHYGECITSAEMADSVNTNASFVRQSLSKLVKYGLVNATRGKQGSYTLARPPAEITLLDIYRACGAAPPFAIHDYAVKTDCAISCNIKPTTCAILSEVTASIEQTLSQRTLAEIVTCLRKTTQ